MTGGAATPSRARRGRPKDHAKREAVLRAARELFFTHGVESVAIEQIAAAAGVSKVTIYARFGDKQAIFEEVVGSVAANMEVGLKALELGDAPIDEALATFGTSLLSVLFSEDLRRFDPLLSVEAARNPEMARRFYEAGPGRIHRALARGLEARAARGEIRVDDAMVAAEQLIGLWQGLLRLKVHLHVDPGLDDAAIEERVRGGVAMFLHSVAPERTPTA